MYKYQFVEKPPKESKLFWISVSKTKTFQTCKSKYFYTYIEKLPRKDWPHIHFGKFLHEVLEFFQREILNGNKDPDNVILKLCFNKSYQNFKTKILPEQKKEAYDILCGFLEFRANKKKKNILSQPLFVEKPFNLIVNDELLINGFIDFLQQDTDGMLHVSDYKTNKDKKYLIKDLFQLKTYSWILFLENEGLQNIRTSYSMLKFNFDEIVNEFAREDVMSVGEYFIESAKEMKEEKLFRANPSPLCKTCDFLDHCTVGVDFLNMLEAKKAKKDGKVHLPAFGVTDW
jgi:CRISPR/Cas system-associated exonuclease Cas4 (RecB family)